MLRLCSDSSRPLSGEICSTCISQERRGTVKVTVMEQKSAEAVVGEGRCRKRSGSWKQAR